MQGNCVICHGTLLYLGEKQVPFSITKFLDESLSDPWLKTVGDQFCRAGCAGGIGSGRVSGSTPG